MIAGPASTETRGSATHLIPEGRTVGKPGMAEEDRSRRTSNSQAGASRDSAHAAGVKLESATLRLVPLKRSLAALRAVAASGSSGLAKAAQRELRARTVASLMQAVGR